MYTIANCENQELNTVNSNLIPNLKTLILFTNLTCNSRCSFCHIFGDNGWAKTDEKTNDLKHLDLDLIKNFINEAIELNPDPFQVILTGGEPTLYKNFEELIAFLKSKNIPVCLLSNGSNLKKISNVIVDHSVRLLSLSLDAPAEMHDKNRGIKGLYTKICDDLVYLIDLKKKARKPFPLTFLNCVISNDNNVHLKTFIEELEQDLNKRNINIKFSPNAMKSINDVVLRFQPLSFTKSENIEAYTKEMIDHFGKVDNIEELSGFLFEEKIEDIESAQNLLQQYWKREGDEYLNYVDLKQYFDDVNNSFGRKRCFTAWSSMTIRPDGEVYLCPDFKNYSIGNLSEGGFKDIFLGDKANKFREVLKNKIFPVCTRCCGLYADYHTLNFS